MTSRILAPLCFTSSLLALGLAACGSDTTDAGTGNDGGVNTGDSGGNTDGGNNNTDAGGNADAGPIVPPTCDPGFGIADACGGSLLGTWQYRSACTDGDPFANFKAACAGATSSNETNVSNGSISFTGSQASGQFNRNSTAVASGDFGVPAICAPTGCVALAAYINTNVPNSSATCTGGAGGACNCHISVTTHVSDSGSFTVVGGAANVSPNGGSLGTYDFCVEQGALVYRGRSGTVDPDWVYVLTP